MEMILGVKEDIYLIFLETGRFGRFGRNFWCQNPLLFGDHFRKIKKFRQIAYRKFLGQQTNQKFFVVKGLHMYFLPPKYCFDMRITYKAIESQK